MMAMRARGMRPPPRDRFLQACRLLPPEVQRCLDITYHMRHPKACLEVKRQVDPATRRRIQALMQGASGPPQPSAHQEPPHPTAQQQPGQEQGHPADPPSP